MSRMLFSHKDLMKSEYEKLGFKKPEYVENPYGIRIYLGTEGEDDWCVLIPPKLIAEKLMHYGKPREVDKPFCNYLITEEEALKIAEEYTRLAEL